jgi:biotin carboxyl carrier protein
MTQRQGYRIRVGEREHEVEVEVGADGERRVVVDGQPFELAEAGAHTLRVSPHVSTEQGAPGHARQIEVTLAGTPRPTEAWVRGERARIVVQTEQEAQLARALGKGTVGSSSGSLTAPMPGRVVKVLVSEGELVALGAPAVIVEAMKMENELHTPAAGVVARLGVREGDTVEAGQLLLEVVPGE